jgi:hypothetical protein
MLDKRDPRLLVYLLYRIHDVHMKSFKKLFAIVATAAMLSTIIQTPAFAAGFSDELQDAYDYAYGMGITTQGSIDSANMYGTLIRSHMAKMMVNYAKELGQTADTSVEVNFTDVADQSTELQGYIEEAAQMGLMGLNADGSVATKFNPDGVVTRAQFGTVLSRVLYGDANNGSEPYYKGHLDALKAAGIMNNISNPNANEVRGYVMLMMQRADDNTTPATCSTAENILACTLGTSACPAECKDDVVVNANGSLSVKLAASAGADVPYGIPSLQVATYKFTADEDVRLDSVVLKRLGYVEDTSVPSAALFINGGRVSKVANFSSSSDEATVTITNGYTVKAGETVEIAVHVTVANLVGAAGDQFSVNLLSVASTAKDVNLASNLTSDTFKILSKANKTLAFSNGTTSENPKAGETAADLFDFKLDNASINNQDVTLKAITFKDGAGTIDEATDLENFKLVVDGAVVAKATKLTGKYLIFDIVDGYVIKEGKNPTFTVKADVIGGANKTIAFTVDSAMDIVAIGNTYNTAVNVSGVPATTNLVTVSAGKVTLTKVNTEAGELLANKDNIFLGAFEIANNADQTLVLQGLTVNTVGTATGYLEAVKVRLGSVNASPIDLTANAAHTGWSETSIEKSIGSKLTVYVYADTADMTGIDTKSLQVSIAKPYIEETENDTQVTDVVPATLSWSNMAGKAASLSLTNVALGAKTVSEGTNDIEAIQFKIKAGTAYGTKIKKMTFDASGAVNTDTVTAATLYNGTTAYAATVKNGSIVIDDDFTIAAGNTATLTLKVNVAQNPILTAIKYSLSGSNIDAEEVSSDANVINIGGKIDGRVITVAAAGEVVGTYESTAANNKFAKNILASDAKVVAEYSVYSKYETVNVGSGIVTFSGNIQNSVLDVQLYYGDTLVASDPTWVDAKTASFDNIDFDTTTAKKALTVKVVSKTIDDNAGLTNSNNAVTSVVLGDLKGNDSGDTIGNVELATSSSKSFNIVSVDLVPAVTSVSTTKGLFTVAASNGSNTTSGGVEAKATLTSATFSIDGNNGGLTNLTVKDDAGNVLGSGAVVGGSLSINLAGTATELSNGGSAEFTVSATVSGSINTPSYNVSLSALNYTTNVDVTALNAQFGSAKTILVK